ncbi:MAG: exosortase [Acidobacteria bacterium]|nr:exosortase [Acidobacteriota bacterium]
MSQSEATTYEINWKTLPWAPIVAIGALLVALFWSVVPSMVEVWMTDEAYSHGLLIPPLAGYIAWIQRDKILAEPARQDARGLLVTALGCLVLLVGKLGAEFFLTRISIVIILCGLILTFWGFRRLTQLSFSLVLLATMVPIPQILYNKMATPLQLFSSTVASDFLQLVGIPVYRDGNIMNLANISLGVAEACSGLRSMSSLTVLGLVVGYFTCRTTPIRALLVVLAIPTAIFMNVVRIVATALMARADPALAEGFFHSFSGWIVFLCGFGILYGLAAGLASLEGKGPADDRAGELARS